MATVKNTITGNIVDVPAHYLEHPILGADLVAYTGEEPAAKPAKASKTEEPAAPETNE